METKPDVQISLLQDSEIDEVVAFYNRLYNANRDRRKFLWEFFQAPAGKAVYVVAKDAATGKIVGTQCAIPIELITSDGRTILSAKSEDTLLDPVYRGMSIFDKMYEKLFDECTQRGILYIWGFTSAKKPFLKLGFEIPFDHSQCLAVYNSIVSYRFLAALNEKGKAIDKAKIFALTIWSRWIALCKTLPFQKKPREYVDCIESDKSHVGDVIDLQSMPDELGYMIKQDSDFLKWRITDNPYYDSVTQISFRIHSKVVGHIIFNHLGNGIWYLVNDLFSSKLSTNEKSWLLHAAVNRLRISKSVRLIRGWDFAHNAHGKENIVIKSRAGFVHINRGISFVWKSLDRNNTLDPNGFILSRLSSQGVN